MKKNITNLLFLSLIFSTSFAQDTIRVMQYNLMQYCDYYDTCTSSNNNLDNKATNANIIINYTQPDIITVEEMGSSMTDVNHFLNNALNIGGVTYWKNGPLTNASGGSIANMIYYDSRKFTLKESIFVQTAVRDFNIYRLYYNTPDLANGDTTFSIANLTNLKELILDGNQISDISYSVANLTNLERLSLRNNKLTEISYSIANLSNLSMLDVRGNQITTTPYFLGQMASLRLLYVN